MRICRFFFFPLCSLQSLVLEEGIGDHRHQSMPVQSLPRSTFEMIEAEFAHGDFDLERITASAFGIAG